MTFGIKGWGGSYKKKYIAYGKKQENNYNIYCIKSLIIVSREIKLKKKMKKKNSLMYRKTNP